MTTPRKPKRVAGWRHEAKVYRASWEGRWALSNWGNLLGVFRTRKDAIEKTSVHTGQPWHICRAFMEVTRCDVTPRRVRRKKP